MALFEYITRNRMEEPHHFPNNCEQGKEIEARKSGLVFQLAYPWGKSVGNIFLKNTSDF
jgi:hypothetical protein